MKQIEAQENLMLYMIVNNQSLDYDARKKFADVLTSEAYPDLKREEEKSSRWWESPAKGLRRVH